MGMLNTLELDSVVSPKNVIANHIIKFVRSRTVQNDSEINEFYKLSDGAEAFEFTIPEHFEDKNVPIKKIKIKRNVLIGGIIRNDEYILPTGDEVLMEGDKVLVVTTMTGITGLSEIIG
jgi:trk system potassium uptake protein TrkA